MIGWRLLALSIVSVAAGGALPAWAGSTGNGAAGTGFPQYIYEADALQRRHGCVGQQHTQGHLLHQGCWSPAHRRVLRLQGRREKGWLQDLGVIHCGPVPIGCASGLRPAAVRHPRRSPPGW